MKINIRNFKFILPLVKHSYFIHEGCKLTKLLPIFLLLYLGTIEWLHPSVMRLMVLFSFH